MDYHYGSYTKSLDPYLKMVREGGLSHKLVAGRSEQLHSGNSLGERVYSMFVTAPDGQVLEYLSPHVSDPESFALDECHFRPVKNFKHLNLTDFEFEQYDISKLGQWAVAARASAPSAWPSRCRTTRPSFRSTRTPTPSTSSGSSARGS